MSLRPVWDVNTEFQATWVQSETLFQKAKMGAGVMAQQLKALGSSREPKLGFQQPLQSAHNLI